MHCCATLLYVGRFHFAFQYLDSMGAIPDIDYLFLTQHFVHTSSYHISQAQAYQM